MSTDSAEILNNVLGRIGGNTSNFLNYDKVEKHDQKIQNDPEMLDLMNEINKLNAEWIEIQKSYQLKARIIRDLAVKRFKELTKEKYV